MKSPRLLSPVRMSRRSRPTLFLSVVVILLFLLIAKSHRIPQIEEYAGLATGPFWPLSTSTGDKQRPSNYDDDKWKSLDPTSFQYKFRQEHEALGSNENYGQIFGNTLGTLTAGQSRAQEHEAHLRTSPNHDSDSQEHEYVYYPYPDYNSPEWKQENRGRYVECETPWSKDMAEHADIKVYKGRPAGFPEPSFGSYQALNIDGNLCFERNGRFGPYGYTPSKHMSENRGPMSTIAWHRVDWGMLQEVCHQKNADRFGASKVVRDQTPILEDAPEEMSREASNPTVSSIPDLNKRIRKAKAKPRTAVLLRAYSGKLYSENDKHNIRALVTELSLRTGGEYQVFLLVQIKNAKTNIWTDPDVYEKAIQGAVPREFWNMTILWDDRLVREVYPNIPSDVNNVHQSQWLSVQKFSQDFPEFEYIWNWELDSRYTGHYYDLLEKLAAFGKAQPRKGLWERNERFYIPSVHGDYDTYFRELVANRTGFSSVWGAPSVANVSPAGPEPPVPLAINDDYQWGVGEEADFISLGPIFNPEGTNWISRNDVWGYAGEDRTPRRATIITQARVSKRLLSSMHRENIRGNHVSSEMTPQTVALLHGFKAVFAPHPVYFDRSWRPEALEKYFNPGVRGESGSDDESPFGWGKESRFHGSTWYYRAEAPMRLYNNWLGWEDTGIGGKKWESTHGRTCLPPMLLHPIKDPRTTSKGYKTESWLPYDDM